MYHNCIKNKIVLQQKKLFEVQVFPPIFFFRTLTRESILLEKYESYQKRSFRNKYIIASAQGPYTLTIPLKKGKHEGQLITEVQISYDESWQKKHLQTLVSAYRNAPFFEYYYTPVQELYAKAGEYLFEFNGLIIGYICELLHLEPPGRTTQYDGSVDQDLRGRMTPKNYQEFPVPPYNQVFEDRYGYLNNLSILDLLFCLGPESEIYLKANAS